jgi:DNA (cytosine-5)-methyltransferase 1
MTSYYNEFDSYAARWLESLIAVKVIPAGNIDRRSIVDVHQSDLKRHRQCHFFAGIGGWAYALRLAEWADERPVWTGSCPCQPFSNAGRRKAEADERHLWPEWFRLISECQPGTIFGEQVAGAIGLGWLDRICADLENIGYACGATVLGAHSVNAPQRRQRLYWVAHAAGKGLERTTGPRLQGRGGRFADGGYSSFWADAERIQTSDARRVECGTKPLAPRVPKYMEQLRAYGNAIVPQLAAVFVSAYMECL